MLFSLAATPLFAQYNLVVAADGSGDYTTVQAAINAATPGTAAAPFKIFIKNGRYFEKDTVHSGKVHLMLIGESVGGVTIAFGASATQFIPGSTTVTYGTAGSATFTVNAENFTAMNITFENTSGKLGDGPQALAINVNKDRAAFKNCRFISGQDTVYAGTPGARQYFVRCYIDGNTDFIFGNAVAVFDTCVVYGRDRVDGSAGGVITAANTPNGQTYGYVFRGCRIPKGRITTSYSLGRPWQNDAGTTANPAHNKTVFINTKMGGGIIPAGWQVWDAGTNTSVITYAEYNSTHFSGAPVDVSARLSWTQQLSAAQAAAYTLPTIFTNTSNTWDPYSIPGFSGAVTEPIALANMRVKKQLPNLGVSWNISWPMSGVKYELFRSADNVSYTKVHEETSTNDTAVAFYAASPLVSGQSQYYFYVKASKAGYANYTTDTVSINTALPVNNEYRSAASGTWTTAATWERYNSATSAWVAATAAPGSGTDVTVRAGHTASLSTSLNVAGSITVESGATVNAPSGASTLRVTNGVLNGGTFGGPTNNNITLEYVANNTTMTLTGSGLYNFNRVRPLTGLVGAALVIDANLALYGSLGAWYNNSSVTTAERISVTINPGDTVTMGTSAFLHNNNTGNTNNGGQYIYNINGVLDLSASTAAVALVPAPSAAASVTVTVGGGGLLKLGTQLTTVSTVTANAGKVSLNIADSARVDGSALLAASYNQANTVWDISGSGALSRKADSGYAVEFPVRIAGATEPNRVMVTNSGAADVFTVGLRDTVVGLPAGYNEHVERQWEISEAVPGGSVGTLALAWTTGDEATGFNASNAFVAKWRSSEYDSLQTTVSGAGTATSPYVATVALPDTFSRFGVFSNRAGLVTGIEDASASVASGAELILSPNPAHGWVVVTSAASSLHGKTCTVTDATGRRVAQFALAAHQRLDVSGWRAGVYLFYLPNGRVQKLVCQ